MILCLSTTESVCMQPDMQMMGKRKRKLNYKRSDYFKIEEDGKKRPISCNFD